MRIRVQYAPLVWLHGSQPVHLAIDILRFFFHALVTRVAQYIFFLSGEQLACLGDVMHVCGGADYGMHQAAVCVRASVRFHAKVPLFAFLRLVHFFVPFAVFVLGGAGRGDDGGGHQGAGTRKQPLVCEILVDQGKYLFGQSVFFQQVTKTQDGGFIRHEGSTVKTGEGAEGG